MRIFPLVMLEDTVSRRDRAHHSVDIEANQPLYTMHSLLTFEVFTHNSRAPRIVYSRLKGPSYARFKKKLSPSPP